MPFIVHIRKLVSYHFLLCIDVMILEVRIEKRRLNTISRYLKKYSRKLVLLKSQNFLISIYRTTQAIRLFIILLRNTHTGFIYTRTRENELTKDDLNLNKIYIRE